MDANELKRLMEEVLRETREHPAAPAAASERALDQRLPEMLEARHEDAEVALTAASQDAILARLLQESSARRSAAESDAGLDGKAGRGVLLRLREIVIGRPSVGPWRRSLGLAGMMAAAALIVFFAWNALQPPGVRRDIVVKPGPAPKTGPKAIPNLRPKPNKEPGVFVKSQPLPKPGKRPAPERLVYAGKLGAVMGEPRVWEPGAKKPKNALPGMLVALGSWIETGDADKLELKCNDGSTYRLSFNTRIFIPMSAGSKDPAAPATRPIPRPDKIVMKSGQLYATVTHLPDASHFKVETPAATAEVLGTEFVLKLEKLRPGGAKASYKATLQVKQGRVAFYNDFGRVTATNLTESDATDTSQPTEPKRIAVLATFLMPDAHALNALGGGYHLVTKANRLSPLEGALRYAYPLGWAGLRLVKLKSGAVRVVRVWAGSAAEEADIRVGDDVVDVDGQVPADTNAAMAPTLRSPGRQVSFTLLRGEQVVRTTLVTRSWRTSERRALPGTPEGISSSWQSLASPNEAMGRRLVRLANRQQDPALFNNVGVLLELDDLLADAIPWYQRAVRANPRVALYHYSLGMGLRQIGNLDRSLEEISLALERDPDDPEIWANLAIGYSLLGRNDTALEVVDKGLARFPNDAGLWFNRGDALVRLNRLEEAAEAHRRSIALEPMQEDAWLKLAIVYREMGRLEEAEAAVKKAIEACPVSASGYSVLNGIYLAQGRFADAEAACRTAHELEPGDAMTLNNWGISLKELGRFEEAEKVYRDAIKADPMYSPAYGNLGWLLAAEKRNAEAERFFLKALDLDPTNPYACADLAAMYEDQKRFKEVESLYRVYLRLRPDTPMIQNNLAYFFAMNGMKLDEALVLARAAVKATPDRPNRQETLGVVLSRLKRWEEAEAVFRRALELYRGNPSGIDSWVELGLVLEARGKIEEAKDTFRKALDLVKDYPAAKEALKRLGG